MEFSKNHNALFLLKVPQDNEILIRTLSDQGRILLLTNAKPTASFHAPFYGRRGVFHNDPAIGW